MDKNVWHNIHVVNVCTEIKRNTLLIHATIEINLNMFHREKVDRYQRVQTVYFHLCEILEQEKLIYSDMKQISGFLLLEV